MDTEVAADITSDDGERTPATTPQPYRHDESGRLRRAFDRLVKPSRKQLASELNTFRIQVETFEERLAAFGEDTFRTRTARRLLDEAEHALTNDDTIAFRHYLYAAKRWQLIAAHQLNDVYEKTNDSVRDARDRPIHEDDGASIDGADPPSSALGISPVAIKAWRLRAEAAESLTGWRKRAVDTLLPAPDAVGSTKGLETATIDELIAASRILHEYYIERDVRRRVLGHQFIYFIMTTIVAVSLILAFTLGTGWGPIFGPSIEMTAPGFLIPVVLFGILGASVSGILTLAKTFKQRRLPDQIDNFWLAIARVSMGAAAALAVFAFLQSGLLQIGPTADAGATLAVAFVAGFSERLLVRAVHAVTGDNGDGDSAWITGVTRSTRPPESKQSSEEDQTP